MLVCLPSARLAAVVDTSRYVFHFSNSTAFRSRSFDAIEGDRVVARGTRVLCLCWNAIRAQQTRAGRNVAIYWVWDHSLEVGVECTDRSLNKARCSVGDARWHRRVVTHLGPYSGLWRAHAAIRDWCKASNHRLARPELGDLRPLAARVEHRIRPQFARIIFYQLSHRRLPPGEPGISGLLRNIWRRYFGRDPEGATAPPADQRRYGNVVKCVDQNQDRLEHQ